MYFPSDPTMSEADLHVLSGALAFGGTETLGAGAFRGIMQHISFGGHNNLMIFNVTCLLPAASQKLIYSKTWDNSLKQLARGNKNIDEVMELPPVKEEWDRLLALRESELVNEKAAASAVDGGSLTAEEETPLSTMRRPPTDFKEHSIQ